MGWSRFRTEGRGGRRERRKETEPGDKQEKSSQHKLSVAILLISATSAAGFGFHGVGADLAQPLLPGPGGEGDAHRPGDPRPRPRLSPGRGGRGGAERAGGPRRAELWRRPGVRSRRSRSRTRIPHTPAPPPPTHPRPGRSEAPGAAGAPCPPGAAARKPAGAGGGNTMNQTATVSHHVQCQSSRAVKVGPEPGFGRDRAAARGSPGPSAGAGLPPPRPLAWRRSGAAAAPGTGKVCSGSGRNAAGAAGGACGGCCCRQLCPPVRPWARRPWGRRSAAVGCATAGSLGGSLPKVCPGGGGDWARSRCGRPNRYSVVTVRLRAGVEECRVESTRESRFCRCPVGTTLEDGRLCVCRFCCPQV